MVHCVASQFSAGSMSCGRQPTFTHLCVCVCVYIVIFVSIFQNANVFDTDLYLALMFSSLTVK